MNDSIYKMGQGVYIENQPYEELADELFEEDPIIKNYSVSIYETEGSKKNKLLFKYSLIDTEKIVNEYSVEQQQQTIENVNQYLSEVTGRTSEHRKRDMKKEATK